MSPINTTIIKIDITISKQMYTEAEFLEGITLPIIYSDTWNTNILIWKPSTFIAEEWTLGA